MADNIFFFCGRSAVLKPPVHMLPGIGWCGAGLPPFPTACWRLAHSAAITGVFCFRQTGQSWRMWWTVCSASLQSQSAESMMPICFRCARRPQCPVRNLNIVVCSCLARWLIGSVVADNISQPCVKLTQLVRNSCITQHVHFYKGQRQKLCGKEYIFLIRLFFALQASEQTNHSATLVHLFWVAT